MEVLFDGLRVDGLLWHPQFCIRECHEVLEAKHFLIPNCTHHQRGAKKSPTHNQKHPQKASGRSRDACEAPHCPFVAPSRTHDGPKKNHRRRPGRRRRGVLTARIESKTLALCAKRARFWGSSGNHGFGSNYGTILESFEGTPRSA